MIRYALPLLLLAMPATAQTDPRSTALAQKLAPLPAPMAMYVTGDGKAFGAAHGLADPTTGRALTADTPMRIASNTKTFVAATVLRLWEQRKIDLDAPIAGLISPALNAILVADKYETGKITVRHLLSHSGGLYDHGNDKRYGELIFSDPSHKWTPETLAGLVTEYADPLSLPGTKFAYADIDYILLGDVIQRITGKNLAAAVREQLKLDKLGLRSTYWEVFEQPRPGAEPRARQFIGDKDVTAVDASFDLYGGGGLVMSARDLAVFFKALFDGKLFANRRTIEVMLTEGTHEKADIYRFGLFVRHTPRGDIYWHAGFWGTYVGYHPESGRVVAAMATNQSGYGAAMKTADAVLTGP